MSEETEALARELAVARGHAVDEWRAVFRILGEHRALLPTVIGIADGMGMTPTTAAHSLVAALTSPPRTAPTDPAPTAADAAESEA